jgi:hypothetical protein
LKKKKNPFRKLLRRYGVQVVLLIRITCIQDDVIPTEGLV